MNINEPLTLENFWNEMKLKYPNAVQKFKDWIDEYKVAVGWDMLFNCNSDYQNSDGKNAEPPKFHDLPHAMQQGIWMEYICDRHAGCQWEIEDFFAYDLREDIEETFKQFLEDEAVQEKFDLDGV